MKSYLLFPLLSLFILACSPNVTRINNEKDKQEAEEFANDFYKLVVQKQHQKAATLFGGGLTEADANEIFFKVDSLLGGIVHYKVEKINTKVVDQSGTKNIGYDLWYKVQYERGVATEEMNVELINDTLR